MATLWHAGVPWFDRAFESAQRARVLDEVTAIMSDYRAGTGSYTTRQTTDDRTFIRRDGTAAIIGVSGVVIGYQVRGPDEDPATPPSPVRGLPRARGGRGGARGPRTSRELRAWLVEEGFSVALANAGHYGVWQGERRVGTLSATASDRRTLDNEISDLRRAGAVLRK